MTLADTSAWVEYLRGTGSSAHLELKRLIETDEEVHTTDVVWMEVLAGGRDETHTQRLRRLLARCTFVPLQGLADHEDAATIFRTCRRAGDTVRAINDCLVAAIAIRAGVDLLERDRDFETIARHTALRLHRA
jgi:predicted nucleic acid-binding protein